MSEWRRVLITGSRAWRESITVLHTLRDEVVKHGAITVVHGDCPTGADLFARRWAEYAVQQGMREGVAFVRHEAYPALWDEFGKSAGPMRNRYMVELGADICYAFPTPESRGTISCMDLAAAAGIPIVNLGWKGQS